MISKPPNKKSAGMQFGRAMVWFAAGLVAVSSAIAGAWLWHQTSQGDQFSAPAALVKYPQARDVVDFPLIDHQGNQFAFQNIKGAWSLLFFGFTTCPDICPDTLFKMKQVKSALSGHEAQPSRQIHSYFISVDPERDTPEKIAAYIAYFDPGMTGLTGDPAMLQGLAMQLGIAFRVAPHEVGATSYDVDHSAGIVLMNPQGQLYGLLRPPHEVEAIVAALVPILGSLP